MSDETTPVQPQEIPQAPRMPEAPATTIVREPEAPATTIVKEPVAPTPVVEKAPVAPVAPAPIAKPAVSPVVPKVNYGAPVKKAPVTPLKTIEIKKDDNPSIVSVAISFVAAAVAVAFAVMIVLDI